MARFSYLAVGALALAATAAVVNAECPNACSGHGECGAFDMCTCDRNFQGADCSEMVCPYGHAFVTTPQGDLNMDGDRDDNTWKRLSAFAQTFPLNSNTITLNQALKVADGTAGNIHSNELTTGDLIRVGNEVFEVESFPTTTKIVTTKDSQYDWKGQSIFRWVQTQSRPNGAWEMWPGDYFGNGRTRNLHTVDDEGHFYMECSNRGICDRESGECQCFDGYTGRGCQRQACPEDCSGHGTCETVDELRKQSPTMLSSTVRTTKHSKEVYTETDLTGTLNAGDWVIIGHYPMQRINTLDKEKLTLYNAFPETLPYGTHAWQVHKYELWDADKGRACKCDPMYTGNDCALRVCPFGDDPLTVTAYDKQTSTSSTATYSEYTQSAERQTLYIDSFNGKNTGSFTLTFVDEYGDKWTTRPIPTRVRLSVTASGIPTQVSSSTTWEVNLNSVESPHATSSTAKTGFPGIRVEELSIGDLVQSGQQIRKVTQLEYNDPNTRTHYKKMRFTHYDPQWRETDNRVWYRITVAKEIREALRSLPNRRILDVTVEALTRGGILINLEGGDGVGLTTAGYGLTADGHRYSTLACSGHGVKFSRARPLNGLRAGDIVRFGDDYRILDYVSSQEAHYISSFDQDGNGADDDATPGAASTAANRQFFKQNGMAYDIHFETGCRTHADCRNNGVDQDDSDGPDATDGTEGNDMGATCHAGGACVCSSSTYYGPGCTKTGRGHHAAPKKQVSGDIRNLICDKSGLTPSHPMRATVTVNRATPELVTFTTTRVQSDGSTAASVIANVSHVKVGNRIRIGEQVRTIVSRTSADNYMVDSPFKEDEFSGITAIFPWYTPVEIVESESASYIERSAADAGTTVDNDLELATCVVTDIRALSSTTEHCGAAYSGSHGQTPHCAKGDAQGADDYNDRVVTLEGSGVLMDRREVRLGDRVRRIKVEGTASAAETWETRTVDSLTFDTNGDVTGFVVTEAFNEDTSDMALFNDGAGTTEAVSCSRRGLCDETTGECQCFAGYTDVDCSVQNSLAL